MLTRLALNGRQRLSTRLALAAPSPAARRRAIHGTARRDALPILLLPKLKLGLRLAAVLTGRLMRKRVRTLKKKADELGLKGDERRAFYKSAARRLNLGETRAPGKVRSCALCVWGTALHGF